MAVTNTSIFHKAIRLLFKLPENGSKVYRTRRALPRLRVKFSPRNRPDGKPVCHCWTLEVGGLSPPPTSPAALVTGCKQCLEGAFDYCTVTLNYSFLFMRNPEPTVNRCCSQGTKGSRRDRKGTEALDVLTKWLEVFFHCYLWEMHFICLIKKCELSHSS